MILDNSCPACLVLIVLILAYSGLWVVSCLSSPHYNAQPCPRLLFTFADLTNISSDIISVYLQLKTHSAPPDSFISSKYKITSKI